MPLTHFKHKVGRGDAPTQTQVSTQVVMDQRSKFEKEKQ